MGKGRDALSMRIAFNKETTIARTARSMCVALNKRPSHALLRTFYKTQYHSGSSPSALEVLCVSFHSQVYTD